MSYYADPFGRRRGGRSSGSRTGGSGTLPTLEDYQALAQAYQELKNKHEETHRQLTEANRELQVKNEVLQRQSADVKNLESELVWTRAALNSQEPKPGVADGDDEKDGWRERFLRLQAEVDNMRKRWDQRFENETAEARHQILRDMLPVADHLEMALQHGETLTQHDEARDFLRNVEATLRAFLDTLRRYGVEPIPALGEPFDPTVHEAVGQIFQEGAEPDTVVKVVQTGYREGERLLRPARVLVGESKPNV